MWRLPRSGVGFGAAFCAEGFVADFLAPAGVLEVGFAFVAFLAAGALRASNFLRSWGSCSRSWTVWSAGRALTRARARLSE
ncbi:hypothetical protein ADK35_40985 [Streptomyces viridochromogenes]|nr:hypothetical protein ADK35_40985 [Streptomyces viridochromogenes]KOG09121.1 hypothetical protein ADK36_41720 [Streptomyces viridochromogenes]